MLHHASDTQRQCWRQTWVGGDTPRTSSAVPTQGTCAGARRRRCTCGAIVSRQAGTATGRSRVRVLPRHTCCPVRRDGVGAAVVPRGAVRDGVPGTGAQGVIEQSGKHGAIGSPNHIKYKNVSLQRRVQHNHGTHVQAVTAMTSRHKTTRRDTTLINSEQRPRGGGPHSHLSEH